MILLAVPNCTLLPLVKFLISALICDHAIILPWANLPLSRFLEEPLRPAGRISSNPTFIDA